MLRVLGIESTAHTFGIGWTDGRKIIQYNDIFKPKPGQGMIPRELAEHHAKNAPLLLKKIMKKCKQYDAISFSQGPGIGQPLQVGTALARYLSIKLKKPVYGVNHCMAHLEIGAKSFKSNDPLFVYVSGGNTQIIIRQKIRQIMKQNRRQIMKQNRKQITRKNLIQKNKININKMNKTNINKMNKNNRNKITYRVLGETLDIGIGNVFDVFSRKIGISNGAELERFSEDGQYVQLPYTVKGMNLVFTGLLTAAEKALAKNRKKDVSYSLMHNAFAMVTETVERALCLTNKKQVIVVGGVAKNKMFKRMIKSICKEHGANFYSPPDKFNGDNGGMIAYAGHIIAKQNNAPLKINDIIPKPYWRVDEVKW